MELSKFNPIKLASGSIGSVPNLCAALDISQIELNEALSLNPSERYTPKSTPKKDGSLRVVNNPHYLIRKIQRRINRRIFSNKSLIAWPDHIYGSK